MVSIIIPTYNRARTIEKSIYSVLNQTYQDIEVIVVDDCSTDETQKIVNNINDKRVRYVKMEFNGGACAARNRGIDEAKGDYIAFQDSDDVFYPEKIEVQLAELNNNNADVVFCAAEIISIEDARRVVFPIMESGFKTHHDIAIGFCASTQTILGKREVFEKYHFDTAMVRLQDYDIMMRISQTESVFFDNRPLVTVYMQADSITNQNYYEKTLKMSRLLLTKYAETAVQFPDWKSIMLENIAQCLEMTGENAVSTYKELYYLNPTRKNKMKVILGRLGFMRLYYKLGNKIKEGK